MGMRPMIDVFKAEAGSSVKKTIDDYYANKLKRLGEPDHLIEESQISRMLPHGHN